MTAFPRRVPAVAVVGYKNTGKTTLVTRLVAAFKKEGYRVGTCKHDGAHELRLDASGTDSEQHAAAGADVTLVASRTQAAKRVFYAEEAVEPPLERWLAELSDPALALDLIIVEGWKHSTIPKIVMLGEEKSEQFPNVLAYVSDLQISSIAVNSLRVYDRDDIVSLIHLIKQQVM